MNFLVDSGASINTVTEDVWKEIAESKVKVFRKSVTCDRRFTAYASRELLRVTAKFETWISVNSSKPEAYVEFYVIERARKSLLSKATSEELRVLKVGLDVHNVTDSGMPFPKFSGVQVKLSIDRTIPPKKVAYLRVPAAMEKR